MKARDLIEFIEEIGRLKLIPRTGWRFHGIEAPESVADHSYRVALVSMVLGDMLQRRGVKLDMEKLLRMAILHEIPEAKIGDVPFPAFQYLPEETKENAEKEAVRSMTSKLGELGERYTKLWTEFEERGSLEAKVVRAADKLELMIQVYEYEKIGYRNLDRFWVNPWNRRDFDVHPIVNELMKALESKRKEIFKLEKERGENEDA
ncbi:TPA: HD domain-containing protein [Candidatus Poribacteria bacterium]|nr:HD domain-containing protein [Candidatus Poribacteria bacterium]HEX28815.1 HD domain-containing protein [Candidatus Poribacteria bacterium]